MGTHPIFESDFDCLTDPRKKRLKQKLNRLWKRKMILKLLKFPNQISPNPKSNPKDLSNPKNQLKSRLTNRLRIQKIWLKSLTKKTVKSTGFPDDAKSDDKQTDKEEIDVGSLNDRLTAYQSRASITTAKPVKSPENDTGKISSIDRFKSNYLRKAETSTSSSPSSVNAPTPSGTMSLRERMKMFENQNSGRTFPRETVTQAERASDIRSKISSWGQGTSSNQYHREKIHVGSIDERRNQYASMAKI